MAPRIAAFSPVFLIPFPARNAAPPFETWIITGELISLAACNTALIVEEEVQLKAGRACPFFLQYSINFMRLSPVTTPAGTSPSRPMVDMWLYSSLVEVNQAI